MTFAEIKAEVFRRLQEDSTAQVFWTEAEVEEAIHDGEDEMADATEWLERWQTIDILKDRPYYDLRTNIRRNFLIAGPVFNDTTNRWLTPVSAQDLDKGDRRWEERIGEPEFFMIRGLWWLGLWPFKGNQVGSVKQYYRALPIHMAEDSDEPGFHRTFHYGLVEYAVADLHSQDGEVDLAWRAWKRYAAFEAKLADYIGHRAYIPTLSRAGGA